MRSILGFRQAVWLGDDAYAHALRVMLALDIAVDEYRLMVVGAFVSRSYTETNPSFMARTAAWVRSETSSLEMMRCT